MLSQKVGLCRSYVYYPSPHVARDFTQQQSRPITDVRAGCLPAAMHDTHQLIAITLPSCLHIVLLSIRIVSCNTYVLITRRGHMLKTYLQRDSIAIGFSFLQFFLFSFK